MKNTLKFLLPGALALAFVAAPSLVPTVAAQDTAAPAAGACNPEEKAALDAKFRAVYKTDRKAAYQASKDYLAKCGNDVESADFVKYLQNWNKKYEEAEVEAEKQAVRDKCANALKAKNSAEVFSACQAWTAQPWYSSETDLAYPVLWAVDHGVGLATANPPVNTYNDQTIALTKQAIQKIENNSLGNVKWDVYKYKSKEDALAWLNYFIGHITFYNLSGKEADSVPYFFKSLQYESDVKKRFQPYYALGFNYRTQYNKAVQDFQTKYANVTDPTEEFKRDLGIQKALMDRAIDAFARAYKAAADAKAPAAVLDARKKDLEQMYTTRFKNQPFNINEVVASTAAKPLPDPASPVTPVMEETPTTATGTTTGATAAVTETKSPAASTNGNGGATRERTAAGSTTNTTAPAKPAAKPATTTPKKPSR